MRCPLLLCLALLCPGPQEAPGGPPPPQHPKPSTRTPPLLVREGGCEIPCSTRSLGVRWSANGRWLVVTRKQHRDTLRRVWTHRGFTLIDTQRLAPRGSAGDDQDDPDDRDVPGGAPAASAVVFSDARALTGRNRPVFSRDQRWLAWCDEPEPGQLVVHRLRLADRTVRRVALTGVSARAHPTVCAIADAGERVVVFDAGAERDRQRLVVYSLTGGEALYAVDEFREPYMGKPSFEVVLTENYLLSHTRPPRAASGGAYRLVVRDAATGASRGRFGSYVSNATPRFSLLRDGHTLVNGTSGFVVEQVDLRTGTRTELFDARAALHSHFLEVSVSPDERHVVAWSRERRHLVCWDRTTRQRIDVPLARRGVVMGMDRAGRVLLHSQREGVRAVSLAPPHDESMLLRGKFSTVLMDPVGARIVCAESPPKGGTARLVSYLLP